MKSHSSEGSNQPSQAHQDLDARHLLCPMPLIRAESAMRDLEPGQILAIRATDPGLTRDLPAWCSVNGHQLLDLSHQGNELVGLVKKGS